MARLKRAGKPFSLTTSDYARLAGFRHALRKFLRFSEEAAAEVGLTGQHYQAMLAIRGWPEGEQATINDLAQQLLIRHNSAVELVDRLVDSGLIERQVSPRDRRKVELRFTPRGHEVLSRLAEMHRKELRRIGPALERFFAELTHPKR
jgi:DNA-binding MarR family transcriptional regulator